MECSVRTFNFFFSKGYLGFGGGRLKINGGAGDSAESSETGATGANSFPPVSSGVGVLLHESSTHIIEKTTGKWGWIVIAGNARLKKQKKIPLQILPVRLLFPLFRVFNLLKCKISINVSSDQVPFTQTHGTELVHHRFHQLLRWPSEI